jgi:HPt (histidine-containing phosphotransfer) domain-containing protein
MPVAKAAPATDPEIVGRVRTEIGDELYESLVEVLLEEGSSALVDLRSALERGDGREIAERAHRLQGGASSLGATAVTESAQLLQELGRQGGLDRVGGLVDRLEAELARTRAELGS